MEFALTALFVVLAWESFANNRDWSLPITAVGLGVLGAVLVPGQMLVVALVADFVLLVLRYRIPRLDEALKLKAGEA